MINLSVDEMQTIINIATRLGCDLDGDILSFYVHMNKGLVLPIEKKMINNASFN